MSADPLDNPAPDAGPSDSPEPTSIINTPPVDNGPPQSFPDTWRQDMAGDDEKALKQLERFNSPLDLGKSYFEAQKKISSYKPSPEKPGENATPEEIKAYRESSGIPEEASGYTLDFGGADVGDDTKAEFAGFLEHAHATNMSPSEVNSTVNWFLADVKAKEEALSEANDEARINGTADLKSEWGGEFQGNMNSIHSLFVNAPEGTMDNLLESAGADGLKFANNPDNIRWLAGLAKQLNPTATLVPPGPDQAGSIDAEIEKITELMNSPDQSERDKYWKDDKMQARFVQLNQAKQA